jgi:hypothetical protein
VLTQIIEFQYHSLIKKQKTLTKKKEYSIDLLLGCKSWYVMWNGVGHFCFIYKLMQKKYLFRLCVRNQQVDCSSLMTSQLNIQQDCDGWIDSSILYIKSLVCSLWGIWNEIKTEKSWINVHFCIYYFSSFLHSHNLACLIHYHLFHCVVCKYKNREEKLLTLSRPLHTKPLYNTHFCIINENMKRKNNYISNQTKRAG